MLYHYAITPDVFEADAINGMIPAGVVLTQLLRGICDNGLLADLNAGRWMTEVKRNQQQSGVPPAVRDLVESCLRVLHSRNRLIRHPAGSDAFANDEFRWLHWSLERNRVDPLSAVVSSHEYVELSGLTEKVLIDISGVLNAECWTSRQRSFGFSKTETNLRTRLRPLLTYAQKLTLIDPYMSSRENRFFNTVQCCADILGRRDGTITRGEIHIHAGDPETVGPEEHRESKNDRLDRWKRDLRPVVNQWGHSFRVFLWKRRPGGPTFHDRYLITDQCGVDVPGGLDFLPDDDESKANLTTWSALEADQITAIIHKEFHHQKSPYDYLGSVAVNP